MQKVSAEKSKLEEGLFGIWSIYVYLIFAYINLHINLHKTYAPTSDTNRIFILRILQGDFLTTFWKILFNCFTFFSVLVNKSQFLYLFYFKTIQLVL